MDFASASGQNVLLVGPPGSGKTTLINDFMDFQASKFHKLTEKYTLFIASINGKIHRIFVVTFAPYIYTTTSL